MKNNFFKKILKRFGITVVIVSLLYSNTNAYLIFIPKVNQASAATWYNASWLYRVKITIDKTKVASTLTNFPVYVDLANLPVAFFSDVKADGGDIRITTSDGSTEVPVEIVDIDTGAKTGELHFKAPNLSSSVDTDFYIYYKNSGATLPSVSSTYGRNAVWSNGYRGVFHLRGTVVVDSSGNLANSETNTQDIATGKLGKSASFNGTSSKQLTFPHDTGMDFGNGTSDDDEVTFSAWVKGSGYIFGSNVQSTPLDIQFLFRNTSGVLWTGFYSTRGGARIDRSTDSSYSTTDWIYLASTYDGKKLNSGILQYVNGVNVASTGSTGPLGYTGMKNSASSKLDIGAGLRGTGYDGFFNGLIDEVRISIGKRSADWTLTEYNNQNDTSTFYSVGSEEGSAPAGTLSVDIVDSGDSSVANPSISLSPIDFSFTDQTSTGIFGTSDEKIRIDNNTSTATWTVSIAPNDGSTALWQGASNQYDFNDTSLSANDDDGDADSVGGQMTIDPTVATITPGAGCDLTNISTGGTVSFDEDSVDSITLASATTGANTTCSWDITGIGISQTIPAEQPADSYSIDMTVSIIAS